VKGLSSSNGGCPYSLKPISEVGRNREKEEAPALEVNVIDQGRLSCRLLGRFANELNNWHHGVRHRHREI